jgi:opacity protein-like surface antigen
MKKIFLLLFFTTVSNLSSQVISGYGFKAGFTSSQFRWDYSSSSSLNFLDFGSDRKPGINFGFFAEFLDYPYLSFCTELNYAEKGFQKDIIATTSQSPDTGDKVLWKVNFNYINVSLLAKPKLNFEILTPYVLIGPRLDIELSKSAKLDNIDGYKDYSSERFGLKLGAGTEIKLFGFNFLSEFIWDIDFNEIYQNPNVKVTTNSFDLRLGIKF